MNCSRCVNSRPDPYLYEYCNAERAAPMCAAAATTVSPDCDRRARLPVMRRRASRAVLRLAASCRFAWLTTGSKVDVIVARLIGGVSEQQERARELAFRVALRVPRDRG